MKTALPSNELARFEALCHYQILDTTSEQAFDDIAHLARQICGTPIAIINFVTDKRQWFKAKIGVDITEVPRYLGLCPICIQQRDILVIPDTLADQRTKNNPVVTSYPYVRFYAGAPLITPEGQVIGTLCVIDRIPREISQEQVESLKALSRQVIAQLELRRKLADLACTALEYKRMEMQLSGREKLLTDFLENGTIGLHWVGQDGKILWANKAELELLGYSREEYIGRHIAEFHVDPEVIDDFLCKLAANETIHNYEARLRCKDGSIKYVLINSNVLWADGEFIHTRCFTRDITERKQAQQKISEQAALLDISTDAIFVQDMNNHILFWNKGAERLYGWSAAEVIGQNAWQLLDQGTNFQYPEIFKIIEKVGFWQGDLYKITKSGQTIIVHSRCTLVRDEANQPKSILVVHTDITEKKQLEAQFLRAQRMESIGTLASGIAHDLNNVLAPMLMAVQLLQIQMEDERSQRLLPILETNAKRGADLVRQVLSFARGVEGENTLLQVNHLISEISNIVRQTFPKSISLSTDIPTDLWTVYGDATQLHQVLVNLCVNARDAMQNGGMLSITADNIFIDQNYALNNIEATVGYYIVITVSDTGIGMNSKILERIFEPFFTTKEAGKGTGLGLSTVIAIVKSHGGFINVYSELGKGTRFKVYLPAAEENKPELVEHINISNGNGELVLVVDDEAAIREITKTSLECFGYNVILASDGMEAIAKYIQHQQQIKLVLLDMMMPNMDGLTTIQKLENIDPNVTVILMSGLASHEMSTSIPSPSVKKLLSKPYTSNELLNAIHEVIIARG